jgi:hypothetical protein
MIKKSKKWIYGNFGVGIRGSFPLLEAMKSQMGD